MAVKHGVTTYECDVCKTERSDNRLGNHTIVVSSEGTTIQAIRWEDVCTDCLRSLQAWKDARRQFGAAKLMDLPEFNAAAGAQEGSGEAG